MSALLPGQPLRDDVVAETRGSQQLRDDVAAWVGSGAAGRFGRPCAGRVRGVMGAVGGTLRVPQGEPAGLRPSPGQDYPGQPSSKINLSGNTPDQDGHPP